MFKRRGAEAQRLGRVSVSYPRLSLPNRAFGMVRFWQHPGNQTQGHAPPGHGVWPILTVLLT